ncbi:MAG TPA: nucleotide exchange factor GrpE [Terriglobales bacterium]|nr:nucleotide exchange factor GrpE [Terriglobales bacterium]
MARGNGKTDVEQELHADHELPAAEGQDETQVTEQAPPVSKSEVDKIKAERDALLDRLARLQADFENARKRALREQQENRDYAIAEAIKALLPALDSFERALRTENSSPAEFRSGVELIYKQLQDALARVGVQHVGAVGEKFDPHFQEAIEVVDTTDAEDNHVVEELQRGYKLKDRLLRPAMVRVARNPKH